MDDSQPVSAAPDAVRGLVLGPRAFWGVFTAAWICYALLFFTSVGMSGESWRAAAVGALLSTLAPALPAIVLARRRGTLLRPDLTWPAFIGRRALEGLLYVATSVMLAASFFWIAPIEPMGEIDYSSGMMLVAWSLNALFFFVVLTAFLMWTESMERMQGVRALAAREAVLRAEAEAKALRAQFNPHFVFNTLHSLMLLVRAEPDTAEKAIEDVAELIRYASTLQRQEIDQVPLAKELEFARRYLSLEKLRLAERLEVDWAIEEGLDDALVPAFALQTLLENSIKHGISTRSRGGRVRIGAARDGTSLRLTVDDDGAGADPVRVSVDGGSGLRLLSGRLETVYGADAALAWRTEPGDGFTAEVCLPLRRVAESGADR